MSTLSRFLYTCGPQLARFTRSLFTRLQFQNVTLVSSANLPAPTTTLAYESCKPFKKRVLPDTGFGISHETPINTISLDVQNSITLPRNAKLPRTLSANNVANSINTSIVSSSYNGKQIVISKEEDQENMPQNTNFMQTSSSLMDLTKAVDAERTKSGIKIPSPSYFGSARSLLRNSPINLSMDRRNAHIISPLALTTHNRSNGFSVRVRPSSHIIPPSPTNTTPKDRPLPSLNAHDCRTFTTSLGFDDKV